MHHQRGTSGYFNQNRKWYREHCFIKNRYAKGLGVDIEELSVNEVLDIIMETPRILKSPILVDDRRLQVGYKRR